MIKPTAKNILIRVNNQQEEITQSGIILNNARDTRERESTNEGIIEALGDGVIEDLSVGDKVLYREATYWKNGKKQNPDAIDDEFVIVQEKDILLIF